MRPQAGFVPHITTLGQGPRRVLALHCTLAFGGAWAGLSKIVGDDLSLIAPDMPSHGRSADWDETSSFADTVYAASLAAMDEVASDGAPIDIIGHSFGAATALRIAAFHPERIRSLLLFEPVFFAVAAADDPTGLSAQDAQAAPFFAAMKAGDRALGARRFNAMWSGSGGWDKLPERAQAAMIRAIHVVPDTEAFLYEDTAGILGAGVLDRITAPTVLMRGQHAPPAISTINRGLARRIAPASEQVLEGGGHMGPISHPAEVAAVFMDLLARS